MFYVLQLGAILAAILSVFAEYAFTWPFREISWDAEKKKELSNQFHYYGAAIVGVCCFCIGCSSFFILADRSFLYQLGHLFMWFLAALTWYWLIFDIGYALKIDEPWYYLGETANEDGIVETIFGKYGGKWKAFICIALLLLFNIMNIYELLH